MVARDQSINLAMFPIFDESSPLQWHSTLMVRINVTLGLKGLLDHTQKPPLPLSKNNKKLEDTKEYKEAVQDFILRHDVLYMILHHVVN